MSMSSAPVICLLILALGGLFLLGVQVNEMRDKIEFSQQGLNLRELHDDDDVDDDGGEDEDARRGNFCNEVAVGIVDVAAMALKASRVEIVKDRLRTPSCLELLPSSFQKRARRSYDCQLHLLLSTSICIYYLFTNFSRYNYF